MTKKLRDFKNKLCENLVAGPLIKDKDDGRNQILQISFGKGQDDFIIIRQENEDKPQRQLFRNDDNKDEFNTKLSCDFIIIQDKTNLKIAFVECKSNKNEYEKAHHQIEFSRLWFQYLVECYCECFKIDNEEKKEWQKAIQEAKKYLVYPQINDTKPKSSINNNQNSIETKCQKLGMNALSLSLKNKTLDIPNPTERFFRLN